MQLTSSRARLSTDDLDALATSLSRQVLAGEIAEPAARMAIYEAVFKTDLVRSETLRWCHKHGIAAFQHEEMVEAADDFYTRKILDLPSEHQLTEAGDEGNGLDSTGRNGRKFFELGAFADGASAAGSIRQALSDYTLMGRTLLRSVNRTRRGGQVITSTDLLEGSIEADNPLAHLVHEIPAAADAAVAHVIDAGRSDRLDHLYDTHRQAVSGKRGAMRTQIDASTVRATFDLPELERPLDPEVRTRMLRWLEEDTTVALRSVTAFFVPDSDDRAAAMGQLWADFTDEHLEAITAQHYGPQIAELLVREALADHARPGRPVQSRLRSEVKRRLAGQGLGGRWVGQLVETFLAHEHEEHSAWDTDRDRSRVSRDPAAYLQLLGQVSLLPGAPLGDTPAEVRRTLASMVVDARRSTTARRAMSGAVTP